MGLEQLKLYLRVTHNMEDSLLLVLKEMAEEEIKASVCPASERDDEFFKDNKIFDYAVFILTASYYENRFAYSDVRLVEIPSGVTGAVHKLRGAYPYES